MSKIFTLSNLFKNVKIKKKSAKIFLDWFLIFNLFLIFSTSGFSQSKNWTASPGPQKVFIENLGQFHIHKSNEPVLFAYDGGPNTIYFTKKGISYSFLKRWAKEEDKDEGERKITSPEEWKEKEAEERRMEYESDAILMTWENSNPEVEVVAYDKTTDYHSYCIKDKDGKINNINFIKAYNKIVYKNIYPNIDIEYVFHPSDGLKYSVILHPGADISKVKMKYSGMPEIKANGDVYISTKFGDIIDHAPSTFYSDEKSNIIASKFIKNGYTISFDISSYDNNKTVIIDPWTQTPILPNSKGVWECERDGAGNVYITGGDMPMKLLKYTAAGTLVWTYNTPYDTANNWLGTFVTDLAGNSFVTSGSIAALQKINTNASMLWNAPTPMFNTDEYWNIAFNCDQTKIIIGGTTGSMFQLMGAIFDINTNDGSVNSVQVVGNGNMFGFPPIIEEVRSITSSRNSRYYFLTLDTIGAIDDDFTACSTSPLVFRENSGYSLAYKCENFRPNNGNSGIMAIRANRYFVYTQNGTNIQKRSLIDGSVIAAAAIPGGLSTTVLGRNQVGNSGIDIDECGNVYVGSGNAIVEFDADLNFITSIATAYKVSDVTVTDGGNIFYCGTTGDCNTTNRTGYLQYSNMSTCDPMILFCCDANICPIGPLCTTDSPVALTAGTSGGTWSGPGVDPSTGIFDPAAVGEGTFTISYDLSCGTSSINIVVNTCVTLGVCLELDGDLTVSGGTGPFSWQTSIDSLDCSGCILGQCMPPICNGVIITVWTTFATGNTITPPGTFPIRVVDVNGNYTDVTDLASVEDCGACPTLTINSSNIVGVCAGATDGSFTANTSGGTGPYNYTLLLGATTVTTLNNVSGAQDFTGLAAGTYTLNVIDANNCPGSINVTITSSANLTPSITGPTSICPGGSATLDAGGGYSSYLWSTNENSQTISVSTSGTYTVTVTNGSGCSGSASITVTQSNNVNPSISGQTTICPGESTTLDAGGGYTAYQWSNSASSQTITVSTGGTYGVTVTDANGCNGSTSATVNVTPTIPVTASAVPMVICPGNPVTLTATGGGTYLWNTTPPSYDSVFIVHPITTTTYVVTATYNGCEGTASVTITIDTSLNVTTSTTDAGCIHNDGTATVNVSGSGYTFVWSTVPPQYTQTATGLAVGTYTVTVGYNGCSGVATANVMREPGPIAAFYTKPEYITLDEGPVYFFDQSVGNITHWEWSFGDSTYASGTPSVHEYADTGSYLITLIVTDANGCIDTAFGYIYVNPMFTIYIPNCFTPNDDDRNEVFKPIGVGWDTKNYFMAIYDRWGRELFYTTNINVGWNGTYNNKYDYTKGVQGIYLYLVRVSDLSGKKYTYKGIITLVQ